MVDGNGTAGESLEAGRDAEPGLTGYGTAIPGDAPPGGMLRLNFSHASAEDAATGLAVMAELLRS